MKTTVTSRIDLWASLALALIAFAFAPAAQTGQQVPFRATWGADITISPLAPPLVAVSGLGAGQALHLGAMTAQSIAEIVNLDTGAGVAAYRFIAANGDEVFVDFAFTAIPTSPIVFSIQGVWQVVGGTGRFDGATGSGSYVGEVAFSGPGDAVGRFELQGTTSPPGSLKPRHSKRLPPSLRMPRPLRTCGRPNAAHKSHKA